MLRDFCLILIVTGLPISVDGELPDFKLLGQLYDSSGKLNRPALPLVELLGCLRGDILPQNGGGAIRVLPLLIPKTGSRHLQHILNTEYGPRQYICRCHVAPTLHTKPFFNATFYNGTFKPEASCATEAKRAWEEQQELWHGALDIIEQRGVPMLTVVRHPVDHFLSMFSFRARPQGYIDEASRFVPDIENFLRNNAHVSSNWQLGFLVRKRFWSRHLCHMWESPHEVTEEDLEHVLDLIRRGALLAGTIEQFEASVRMFHSHLDFRNFDVDQYSNFGPRRDSINNSNWNANNKIRDGDVTVHSLSSKKLPVELVKAIEHHFHLDMKLYREVSNLISSHWLPRSRRHREDRASEM